MKKVQYLFNKNKKILFFIRQLYVAFFYIVTFKHFDIYL